MRSYYTIEIDDPIRLKVLEHLAKESIHWQIVKSPGVNKKGKLDGITVTKYNNGKILLQGKSVAEFISKFDYNIIEEAKKNIKKEFNNCNKVIIGADESGKGDYFGPLVTAAVKVSTSLEAQLDHLGICDSKKLSEKQINEMAIEIMERVPFSVQVLMPYDYNLQYNLVKNLNLLLAKQHALNITKLIDDESDLIVVDKFAANDVMEKAMYLPKSCDFIQEERAESKYFAVAAASIIARWHFLQAMDQLGAQFDTILPRGAWKVEGEARKLANKHGSKILMQVAKLHFKTTQKVMNK